MIRYVTLLRFTDQGTRALQQSPHRANAFRDAAQREGVQVESQLWTSGAFDGLLILTANDEQSILRALAQLAAQGNVRTESARAFDATEFGEIVNR